MGGVKVSAVTMLHVVLIFQKALKMIPAALSAFLVLVLASTEGKYIPKSGKRIPQLMSRGWSHDLRLNLAVLTNVMILVSGGLGWGDQLIWAQTYEEALYWSRSRYVSKTCSSCADGELMEQTNQRNPALQEQASDGHLPPGGLPPQPG